MEWIKIFSARHRDFCPQIFAICRSQEVTEIISNKLDLSLNKKFIVNRSRVSIRVRPCKICRTSALITMQNVVAVSHTVCAHVGGPKHLQTLRPPYPLGAGGCMVDNPEAHYSPTCITVYRHYI